ncbi:MAG TPA: Mur ligase domain-containing protein [Candidatus Wallbacteria bacterium]|nr:Mur ligase domain-containing protein [Candidatus Wallbacteria bacterium]
MKSYYFIGILGSGMSALARVAHEMGHSVAGSDRNLSGAICEEFKSKSMTLPSGRLRNRKIRFGRGR